MPRSVALLDANVLYPARLRDFLIRLDIAGRYRGIAFTADKVIGLLPEYRRLNRSIELLANAVCPPC